MISRFLFFFIVYLAIPFVVDAQCVNGTKSYPIYKEGARIVADYDDAGKEIVRVEYDLIFSSKESIRTLSSSWEYTLYAFADDGVRDLDLVLYEYDDLIERWTEVSRDESNAATAEIVVEPEVTKKYKVEVIVSEFYDGYSAARYGLFYIHD